MSIFTDEALAGLRLKSTPEDLRSYTYSGNAKIADGTAVAVAADGRTCTDVATGVTDVGIVTFQHIGKSGRSTDGKSEVYIKGDCLPVLNQGRVWVAPITPVVSRGRATKVYVVVSGANIGRFTDLSTETGAELVGGAFWDIPSNSDGLAVIQINNAANS